jgi:hypothetical protein
LRRYAISSAWPDRSLSPTSRSGVRIAMPAGLDDGEELVPQLGLLLAPQARGGGLSSSVVTPTPGPLSFTQLGLGAWGRGID